MASSFLGHFRPTPSPLSLSHLLIYPLTHESSIIILRWLPALHKTPFRINSSNQFQKFLKLRTFWLHLTPRTDIFYTIKMWKLTKTTPKNIYFWPHGNHFCFLRIFWGLAMKFFKNCITKWKFKDFLRIFAWGI